MARKKSVFPLSPSSAYRWLARFRRETSHLRTLLCRERPPPEGDASPSYEAQTLDMLDEASKSEDGDHHFPDPLASFQSYFQTGLVHP
jgi:hypothetical protein